MASKYAGLKGKIPEQPTEREQALQEEIERRKTDSLADLTEAYNVLEGKAREAAARVKAIAVETEACEILIREKLDAIEGDAVSMNGYTWSPKFEPYPVCEDLTAIVKYFKEHGMADQLELKASELAARLKNLVKEEALANELIIETKTVVDPETGEEREVNDVRSNVSGVRVFLKSSLSRVKSKGAK